jgi:drug/metabolite transporter (DMT)-like permease
MKTSPGISTRYKAIYAMLLSAALSPFFSIAARLVNPHLSPLTQLYLQLGGAFILTLIFFHRKIRLSVIKKIPSKDWFWLFSMGIIGLALGVYFFIRGSVQEKLLNVTVIGSTDTFIVYVLSLLIFKEKFKSQMLLFIVLSLIGVAFLATKSFTPTFATFGQGDLFILLGAFGTAVYIISRQLLSNKLNNFEVTTITLAIVTVSTFILSLVNGEHLNLTNLLNSSVIIGLTLGAVLNVIALPLDNYAFKHLTGILATQLFLSSSVFSLIYGYLLYKEVIGIPELVGSFLILGSVYFTNKTSR